MRESLPKRRQAIPRGCPRAQRAAADFSGIIARVSCIFGKEKRMNMGKLAFTAAIVSMLALSAPVLAAGDAVAGRQKISACQGCHGIPGYKAAFPSVYSVPKLGGQHADYIVKALQAYKSGERSNATMRAIAAGLSDQDMADVAAYYAAPVATTAAK
jgi:cytochrome c553